MLRVAQVMDITGMLCPACRKIFSNQRSKLRAFDPLTRYEHHNPPYLLRQAAESGCYICTRLWNQLSKNEQALVSSTRWWTTYMYRFTPLDLIFPLLLGAYSWEMTPCRQLRFCFGRQDWKVIVFDLHGANGQSVER